MRSIVKDNMKVEVRMADVEADARRMKRVDFKGRLQSLQEPMNESLRIYRDAREELKVCLGRDRI